MVSVLPTRTTNNEEFGCKGLVCKFPQLCLGQAWVDIWDDESRDECDVLLCHSGAMGRMSL